MRCVGDASLACLEVSLCTAHVIVTSRMCMCICLYQDGVDDADVTRKQSLFDADGWSDDDAPAETDAGEAWSAMFGTRKRAKTGKQKHGNTSMASGDELPMNFSRVDVGAYLAGKPLPAQYARFAQATPVTCHLKAGQMLYLPTGWCHVRVYVLHVHFHVVCCMLLIHVHV